ncbi:hypothetical protein [Haloplanus halophilus]|uniref:hypothetical protein n=1 Tax=Haloplanus halophilus TaxID=2949993 RepID=UPI00203DDFB8|nr:hypothetical protein [Haloplanus sp. GDY1]
MVRSRTATAAVGLVASIAVSVAAWYYFDTLLVFLLLPFVPVLFRRGDDRPPVEECPVCDFSTRDPSVNYCPRDGTALDRRDDA